MASETPLGFWLREFNSPDTFHTGVLRASFNSLARTLASRAPCIETKGFRSTGSDAGTASLLWDGEHKLHTRFHLLPRFLAKVRRFPTRIKPRLALERLTHMRWTLLEKAKPVALLVLTMLKRT